MRSIFSLVSRYLPPGKPPGGGGPIPRPAIGPLGGKGGGIIGGNPGPGGKGGALIFLSIGTNDVKTDSPPPKLGGGIPPKPIGGGPNPGGGAPRCWGPKPNPPGGGPPLDS